MKPASRHRPRMGSTASRKRSPAVRRRRRAISVAAAVGLSLVVGFAALALVRHASHKAQAPPDVAAPGGVDGSSGSHEKPEARPASSQEAVAAQKAIRVESYLGGAERDLEGFGPAPKRLRLIWKYRVGSGPTRTKKDNTLTTWAGTGWTGQPTVVKEEGRTWLLVGGYDHNLHKIDAETGEAAWMATWPDVIKGTNTVIANPAPSGPDDPTRLIVVSGSRRGFNSMVGDPGISPLRAVSFYTGEELWRLPVPRTDNYSQDVDGSPLLHEGVLYAPVESGYVYALDPFSTEERDGMVQPKVLTRSPRLYDDADVAAHPDTGGANLAIESSPAAIGDVIYVTSGAGHIYGLDSTSLEIVWDFKTGCDLDGTPSVTADGKLLISLEHEYVKERGGAYLLDPAKPPSEAIVWYYPTPSRGFGEWGGGCIGSVTTNEATNDGSMPRLAALNTIDGPLRVVSIDQVGKERSLGPGAKREAPAPVEVFTSDIGGSISTPVIIGDSIVTAGYGRTVELFRLRFTPAEDDARGALPSPDGRWWTVSAKRADAFAGGAAFESTPLVYGGRVYIGCRDGYLYCLGD